MLDSKTLSLGRPPILWLAGGVGALIWLMLPAGVTVMNDDFGYLGSVVETIQRGRPWTDEWLAPWSASLAVCSALLFKLTGSFQLAVQGLQIAGVAGAAALAFLLFRDRGLTPRAAAVAVFLGLSFPTLLWKSVEYTSLVVYLPCLLGAIWAAGRRRWVLFSVFFLTALASRQSALAWLALPLGAIVTAWRAPTKNPAAWLQPVGVLAAALIALVVLTKGMNHTQAQATATDHPLAQVEWSSFQRNAIVGLGIGAVFAGLGALLVGWHSISSPTNQPRPGRTLLVLALGVGGFGLLNFLPRIYFEHAAFDGGPGQFYANLLIAVGMAGWILPRFALRRDLVFAGLAALALVCLRADVWDYYYADVAIFALCSVGPELTAPTANAVTPRWLGPALLLIFAGSQVAFACDLKCRVDRDYAACIVAEKALRSGRLDVVDLGAMPFGFIGWQLHHHYIAHEGKDAADHGGYIRYLQPTAAEPRLSPMRFWRDSRSLQEIQDADATRLVGSEVFRVGWLWHQRYTLLRSVADRTKSSAIPLDRSSYQPRRLPLTDAEWRTAIENPAR